MSRVRIAEPGPGYCHWPEGGNYPADYFEQLTAERRILTHRYGRPVHRWVLKKGLRNEALDIRVYGLALISVLKPQWSALAARISPGAKPIAPIQHRPLRRVARSKYLRQN